MIDCEQYWFLFSLFIIAGLLMVIVELGRKD
jgi:hypothetical protein